MLESVHLTYLRNNHQKRRASVLTALCVLLGDFGNIKVETDAIRAGRLFISSSSHVGANRYMLQNMHDFIATSNVVGYPDIF